MEFKDYYQVMGLARDAGDDDIKKAYRRLARKYHPDVSKEPQAEARFKELGEAYEVLKDAEKRAAYDRLGADWKQGQEFRPPPDWNAGFESAGKGFTGQEAELNSDFFESLFRRGFGGAGQPGGAGGGRGGGGGTAFHANGEDRHAKIQIDLEDAYHGAARQVSLQIPEVDAQGQVSRREHHIEFKIPKGVRAGQHIRLAGQGSPGYGDGSPGDLYLEIEFRPHAVYRIDQRDVYVDLPVAPWEATLGAQVEVATPSGTVEITIPANSKAGRKLRLKGRGIPGGTPGDFYFVVQIALPAADSDAARAFYGEMAQHFKGFNPRAKTGAST